MLRCYRDKTAIIFAGGKSSRMGCDKALLPFSTFATLAEYQHYRLQQMFGRLYISTKEDKFDFVCEHIYDLYAESSPLVGLVSTFETIDEDEIFVLSVDAPFVESDTIAKLYEQAIDPCLDAIVAQSPQGKQPLCAIYRRSILPLAQELLSQEQHRLNLLLQNAKTHFVHFDDERRFRNLNYSHEYDDACCLTNLV